MIKHIRNVLLALAGLLCVALIPAQAANNPSTIPTVSSIAALKALGTAAPLYPTIYVLGYSSALTPGGGAFNWQAPASSNNSCTDDGGVVIDVTSVSPSVGCYVRLLGGSELWTQMYGAQSGNDITSIIAKMVTTSKALFGINVKIGINQGSYTVTPGTMLDTSTLPSSQSLDIGGELVQPGLTYVVRQTSGGGTIVYANTTYTDGQTITGAPGYRSYKPTNARLYLQTNCADIFDASGGVQFTVEGEGYKQTTLTVSGNGAGFCFDNSTDSRGPRALSLQNLYFHGTADGSPQIGMWIGNANLYGKHNGLIIYGFQVGLYSQNCWNQNWGTITFGGSGAYAVFDNNNENSIDYLFLQSSADQPKYTVLRYHDNSSTNFVSAGAAVGDQVWAIDQLGTAVLKGVVTSVGWWDGSTTHTDMLIIQMNAVSTASGDLSQFGGDSRILFKSGTLSGNQYTMDVNPSTTAGSSAFYDPYLATRIDSGAVYMTGVESFKVSNAQGSNNLGESIFVVYSSNSTSFNGFGSVQFDQEGPSNGFVDRPIEYLSYTQTGTTPTAGTMGPTINVATSIPFSTAGGYTSAFGQISGVRGTYLSGATITGTVTVNHAAAYGLVLAPTTWADDHSHLNSQLTTSATSGWGILDLQQQAQYPVSVYTPFAEQTLLTTSSFNSSGSGPTIVTGSRVFRTSLASTPSWYGVASTPPRVFVDLDTDLSCGTISGTSGAAITLQYDVLADDDSTVKYSRYQRPWFASSMVGGTHYLDTIRVPTNANGKLQFTANVTGTGWATCVVVLKQAQGGY